MCWKNGFRKVFFVMGYWLNGLEKTPRNLFSAPLRFNVKIAKRAAVEIMMKLSLEHNICGKDKLFISGKWKLSPFQKCHFNRFSGPPTTLIDIWDKRSFLYEIYSKWNLLNKLSSIKMNMKWITSMNGFFLLASLLGSNFELIFYVYIAVSRMGNKRIIYLICNEFCV